MKRRNGIRATVRETVSGSTPSAIFGGVWTIVALLVAITSTQRGTGATVIWWAVFPVGLLLVHYSPLSAEYRLGAMVGTALSGSALVCIGAWMAWPWYSPLYTGIRIFIQDPIIAERGYQLFDLPLVATALSGGLGVLHYRNHRSAPRIALAAGLGTFLLGIGVGWFVGDGFWTVSWGYYVTLGGTVGLVYAGLFGLSSPESA